MQVSHGTMGIGVGERLYRWVLMDLTSVQIQSTIGTLDLTTYFAPPCRQRESMGWTHNYFSSDCVPIFADASNARSKMLRAAF